MVNGATHISAAQLFEPLTTEYVCENKITLWETAHTGLPNTLVFDDGS